MSRKETLEDLMERPLYEHVRVVPPLLESAAGADVASEYERRVNSSDWGGYPDIGFLNTIRYAKQYLENDLEADESVAHYLGLITMEDWKKNRSHPESSDAAFDGPMSESAYPDDHPMNEVARKYNEAHGFVDESTRPTDEDSEGSPGGGLPLKGLTLEHLMAANPLEILRTFPEMLEVADGAVQEHQLVDRYYDEAQQGDYQNLYRLTIDYAERHLATELAVTKDAGYYLALSN